MIEISLVVNFIFEKFGDIDWLSIGLLVLNMEVWFVDLELGVDLEVLVGGMSELGEFWVCGL